jgi:ATPase subunit of ABC transporter with duplicated ATPase domains
MSYSVTCTGLRFAWPDGAVVFDGLDFAAGPGRTGLIGVNGSGKSTLLRLIAGELAPSAGTIRVSGEIGYLPQNITLAAGRRVEDVLGVADVRAALAAIERGDASKDHFVTVGDDWDVEERTAGTLDRLGLGAVGLDRPVGDLSGGETVLLGLAALLLGRPGVLLLDEPTNNLDLDARRRLYGAVESWPGALVVVSHDRELLDLVDQIADLRPDGVHWYGGNLSAYEEALAVEQEAAARTVRAAESDVRRQQRDLVEARTKLDRRQRYGRRQQEEGGLPKIVAGARKRQAQVTAGKHRLVHEARLDQARERLAEAEQAIRDDGRIAVDLPKTAVPAGRTVLTLVDVALRYGGTISLDLRGPERIALVGANGAGKTTLLRTIAGQLAPVSGDLRVAVPVRYLPQRLDVLDDARTLVENVSRFAPAATNNAIRARLARFLFRGTRADQVAGTLSGGERFRATLAALLLAEPPPQLLLLDEPTNNLDMASARQLSSALATYHGALIVASHDVPFLRSLEPTRWLRMEDGVTDTEPL